ncbi:hypothetical protein IIC_02380 [Bacillus cereus VD021]|uniref:Uncharacterized protein n=1 Tax=Bacillus cereus VD021 TaxID=1053224 RepID=R8HQ93_BACCE|nr:hypothetical protein [Bacillus cereus]EOO74926.1 hypothetical protein IIC_02380 [Bacillus cereus VD021]
MLKFHCHTCEESFNISFENLYNKESICCQNCGHYVPTDVVKSLRDFSTAYMDAVDSLYNAGEYKKCWSLSIAGSDTLVPKKKEKLSNFLDNLDNNKNVSYWKHRSKKD